MLDATDIQPGDVIRVNGDYISFDLIVESLGSFIGDNFVNVFGRSTNPIVADLYAGRPWPVDCKNDYLYRKADDANDY